MVLEGERAEAVGEDDENSGSIVATPQYRGLFTTALRAFGRAHSILQGRARVRVQCSTEVGSAEVEGACGGSAVQDER